MKNDLVNNPKHYTSDPSGIECIQITRHRNFNIGNAIKYLWRSGLKATEASLIKSKKKSNIKYADEIQDLNKAVWYIVDEIHRLGGKCEVATDLMTITFPYTNEGVIKSCLNYSDIKNNFTILGILGDNETTRKLIKHHLDNLLDDVKNIKEGKLKFEAYD